MVAFSGAAPSITMGERHRSSHWSSKKVLAGFPIRRFIFSHHHVAAVLVALIAQATASMVAEVCGAVTRMHCSRAGALSRRDRLYTRSTAREIVRRERLITTSSGK